MGGLVSIVLPAYNEESAIGRVIDDIKESMEGREQDYELIVVDDGSTDRTNEIARSKEVRVVRHPENRGSGTARKTGILEARGDIVVMIDADGTYPAKSIPEVFQYFPEYDQVSGARGDDLSSPRMLRKSVKWLIRKFASFLADSEIPDLNTGFKAFKREVALRYIHLLPSGFSGTTTLTLSFLCNGHFIKHIPIAYYPRIGLSKFRPVKDTYNYILTVVRLIMYFNPLRIFLPVSLIIAVIGVIKTLYDVYFKSNVMEQSDIIIMLTAVIVATVGLLADLIVAQGKR